MTRILQKDNTSKDHPTFIPHPKYGINFFRNSILAAEKFLDKCQGNNKVAIMALQTMYKHLYNLR